MDGGQERWAFHNHLVAGRDQRFAQQIQRLLAAGGDDQLLGGHIGGPLAGHEGRELLTQRLVAFGGTVLQCRAGRFGQCLLGGLPDALHIEQRRIRETTRKADDAGLAQQLEQFADGGGFNVANAVGKTDGGCVHR